ncbi:MAG: hypothetical protein JO345_14490 [Streptosporangiaceae bacterium]|nr:hypothetical protein [Streptosporangiaceae bacterium]
MIAALLLGACDLKPGRAPGIRLRGARISGRLDLMGGTLTGPLVCEGCYFDTEPRFTESAARTVWIAGSRLPGFDGTRMRLDGILNLRSSAFGSAVRLDQAKVTGQVCLRDATVGGSAGEVAVAAEGLIVEGNADLAKLTAHGIVWLEGAQVSGMIDLTEATLIGGHGGAITFSNASIGGRLRCDGLSAEGTVRMRNTEVGAAFVLSGARLSAPAGLALDAGGLVVKGGVFLVKGFTAEGQLRLIGARLGANLSVSGAEISNPGAMALNLDGVTMGNFDAAGIVCAGQVSCVSGRFSGGLDLASAHLDSGDNQPALNASGVTVEGPVVLSGMRVRGEVNFRSSHIRDLVQLNGASMENPGQLALCFSHAEITADVSCEDITVTGTTALSNAKIAGTVSLERARLENPAGVALDARHLQVGQIRLISANPVRGAVDLSHAHVGLLVDDPASWPAELNLSGLTYQSLEPQLTADERLSWLALSQSGQKPQPYEQLAGYYNAIGQPAQARRILYARERRQRNGKGPLGRAWSLLQDLTVGYGYQPWRAASWLLLLLVTGTAVFYAAPPAPLQDGAGPHFNSVIYTLDLMLPIVNLGQKGAFSPTGAEQWFSYALMAAGWVLATTIAAGIARVLRRA